MRKQILDLRRRMNVSFHFHEHRNNSMSIATTHRGHGSASTQVQREEQMSPPDTFMSITAGTPLCPGKAYQQEAEGNSYVAAEKRPRRGQPELDHIGKPGYAPSR